MTVYFLQAGDRGPVKIGFCRNGRAWQRWHGIQQSNFATLSIVGLLGGGVETEAYLRHHFARLRIRGEWFRCGVRLRRLIDRLPHHAHKKGQMPTQKLNLDKLRHGKLVLQRI